MTSSSVSIVWREKPFAGPGLAPRAAEILRQQGFDAVLVSEIGMERADDSEILEKASVHGRVCVTLDQDFHAHLAVARCGSPSVILLRVQGLDAQAQAELIRAVYSQCEQVLRDGAAVSANQNTIRIRRLPLK